MTENQFHLLSDDCKLANYVGIGSQEPILPPVEPSDISRLAGSIAKCPMAWLRPPEDSLSAIKHLNDASCPFDKGCPGKLSSGGVGEQTVCNLGKSQLKTLVYLESQTLLFVKAKVGDYVVDGLVDNRVNYNFISSALVYKLGWEYQGNGKVTARLADGSTISSQCDYRRLVAIGPQQYILPFMVLDSTFDMVLVSCGSDLQM